MAMPTIGESWDLYVRDVMPADAGPEQIQEMRRAFYAGTWTMLCFAREMGASMSREMAAAWAKELVDECARNVLAGRA